MSSAIQVNTAQHTLRSPTTTTVSPATLKTGQMPRALRGALKDKANSTAAALDLSRAYTSGVLLAHTYEKQKPPPNPEGWWVSEKLDGVRAYWNGESFFSRSGNQYFPPAFFTEGLPKDIHLDGELWLGALECAMPVTGVTFKIGSGFRMDEKPKAKAKAQWPVGTVVSYKYQGLTTANSKPRFPTYLRIRTDKTWGEVEADARADLEFAELGANGSSLVRAPSLMEKTSPKTPPVNMPAKVPVEPIQTPNSPRELAKDSGTEDDSVAHLQRTGKKRRPPKRAGSGGVGVGGEIVGGGGEVQTPQAGW